MQTIFSGKKGFDDPFLGDLRLNRLGLYPLRIAASDAALGLRRTRSVKPSVSLRRALAKDGLVKVEGFLPPDRFRALQQEVHERLDRAEREHPYPVSVRKGFGPRQQFPGGHDHYDGSTLCRNLEIDRSMPHARKFTRSRKLATLLQYAAGHRFRPARARLYQNLYFDNSRNPDVQAQTHKDTFHSTIKFWYFVEDCPVECGPFAYSFGSHRMTLARYRWEYLRANEAARTLGAIGSFRVDENELAAMGCAPPQPVPVAANTLVVADTRGFHRRTLGQPGTRRRAIHGVLPRDPFALHP